MITFHGSAYPKISQQCNPATHTEAVHCQRVLLGVFHPCLCLWPLKAPGSSFVGRVTKPLVSSLTPVPPPATINLTAACFVNKNPTFGINSTLSIIRKTVINKQWATQTVLKHGASTWPLTCNPQLPRPRLCFHTRFFTGLHKNYSTICSQFVHNPCLTIILIIL